MLKSTIKAAQLILAGSMLFLVGCNAPPAQPTLDPNMIYTAAAQTVQAQLAVSSAGTATAAAVQPTATQPAPTEGPTLLATVGGQPTLGATLSINLTPGAPTIAPGGATAVLPTVPVGIGTVAPTVSIAIATLPPTAAPTVAVLTGEKGMLVNQDPDDGASFPRKFDFDQIFEIQNTGTTTWNTTDYLYSLAVGNDQLAKHTGYALPREVKPNDIVKLTVDMKTPDASGKFVSKWCLTNKNNPSKCIVYFDVTINVP
jgi:hypothetical protein